MKKTAIDTSTSLGMASLSNRNPEQAPSFKSRSVERVDYLRLSVTDLCNLNCIYCTPLEKEKFLTHREVLRYEEMHRLVKIFAAAGIRKVRITGGEPLYKRGIIDLIKMLKSIDELEELSLTTNGVLLKDYANQLKDAGLNRINISLDTLKRERFARITGKDCFEEVWKGVESSMECGFQPLKLNVVPMKGINEDEIIDFARLTLDTPLVARFIEFFHTNRRSRKLTDLLISKEEVKKVVENFFGKMKEEGGIKGNGPALYYRIKGAKGAIGFINGSTSSFCGRCNRIRVDCAGRVSPCLFSGPVCDTRVLLRGGDSDEAILEEIKKIIKEKPNYTKEIINQRNVEMSSLGG